MTKSKSLKDARERLPLSHLDSQRELLSDDIDLTELSLISSRLTPMRIEEAVIAGTINRTIEGASTVDLTVNDRYGYIRRSGRLGAKIDIKMDGLWFRLVKVTKSGNDMTLSFESREVAILRTYNKFRASAWGDMKRARFAQILVAEPTEFDLPFICPELKKGDKSSKFVNREPGFGGWADAQKRARERGKPIIIKGAPPTSEQLRNCEEVIDEGYRILKAGRSRDPEPDGRIRRKILVCAMMTIIQESTCYNNPWGDVYGPSDSLENRKKGSVGLFQQQPSWGTFAQRMDPTHAANSFFKRAIDYDARHPNVTYAELCQAVQVSAFPDAYSAWRVDGERLITGYGIAGSDYHSNSDTAKANNMSFLKATGSDKYQFMRGRPKSKAFPHGEKENTWDCLQRLADEVNWRCFEVSGAIYFMSEPYIFKSSSRANISQESEGVDWIDFDYDVGKKNAAVTVTARMDEWAAPPGTIMTVHGSGPINGRWLVSEINRGIFDKLGTITLKKPRPKLREPKRSDLSGNADKINVPNEFEPTDGQDVTTDHPRRYPVGRALRRAVLNNPMITYTRESQKTDIKTGLIRASVLEFMIAFTEAGFPIVISALRSDHNQTTTHGNISAHSVGKAVDMGNYDEGHPTRTDRAMRWIAAHQSELGFSQMIGPIDDLCINGTVHGASGYPIDVLNGHNDHIHMGWALTGAEAGRPG